jgi:hypothetical protein
LSTIYDENCIPDEQAFLRWTAEELKAFAEGINGKPVGINVLEYFGVVYLVLLWGRKLSGQRVGIKSDNTPTVAWLLKSIASTKSPVGETLVQIFSLYCIALNITLVPSHVAGVENVRADYLSRDMFLQEPSRPPPPQFDPDEQISLRDQKWWQGLRREEVCRQLLKASIARPWSVPSQSRLELLNALL